MKIKLLLVMSLGLCVSVHADENSKLWYTAGSVNGRFWQSMSDSQKVHFLYGFSAGMQIAAGITWGDKKRESVIPLFESGLTYGEDRRALDRFYSDPANAKVLIKEAIPIEAKRAKGASSAEVEQETAYARWRAVLYETPEGGPFPPPPSFPSTPTPAPPLPPKQTAAPEGFGGVFPWEEQSRPKEPARRGNEKP